MMLRILAFIVLLCSMLFGAFWLSVILAFCGMIYFNVFWEASFLFLLSDLLYGTREGKNSPVIFVSFLVSVLVLIIIEIVKTKINFHKR